MNVTKQEADALRADGDNPNDPSDVIAIEELAALYVQGGGTDPRPVAIVAAAKAAGKIDADGNYVGPESTDEG